MLLASTVNKNIYTKVPKSRKPLANYYPRMSLLWSFSYQLHAFPWSLCTYFLFISFPAWGYGHSFKDTPTFLDVTSREQMENGWSSQPVLWSAMHVKCGNYHTYPTSSFHTLRTYSSTRQLHSILTLGLAKIIFRVLGLLVKNRFKLHLLNSRD